MILLAHSKDKNKCQYSLHFSEDVMKSQRSEVNGWLKDIWLINSVAQIANSLHYHI